jgi:hypothetical protein
MGIYKCFLNTARFDAAAAAAAAFRLNCIV